MPKEKNAIYGSLYAIYVSCCVTQPHNASMVHFIAVSLIVFWTRMMPTTSSLQWSRRWGLLSIGVPLQNELASTYYQQHVRA
jgi:hypothetical protein